MVNRKSSRVTYMNYTYELKIMNYQYVYNDEDGLENHKIYSINLLDLIGENLATCIDNQNKTCYKIPMIYYNKIKDYPIRIPNL